MLNSSFLNVAKACKKSDATDTLQEILDKLPNFRK